MTTTPIGAPPGFDPVREIGAGATSVVWEAVQRSTRRAVALKVLTGPVDDPAARRRFERECQVMAALATHPNIVTIFDAGVHDGRSWIAMELCRRGSFAIGDGLDAAAVLDILIPVADALDVAHRLGVLHCDLKPANILITDHGAPAIADFGIARPVSGATITSTAGYSLDHAAPEVLDGQRPTVATDVYCLGTTVWTLLSGRPPFRDGAALAATAVVKRILLDPLPPTPTQTPPALTALVEDMTRKDPAERVGSMAEVARRAREARAALGMPSAGPGPLSPDLPAAARPAPVPQPRSDEPDHTFVRPLRGRAPAPRPALAPMEGSAPPSPMQWPARVLLGLTGVITVALVGVGAVAASGLLPPSPTGGGIDEIPSATPLPASRTMPEPADDLGLGVPLTTPVCDGRFIVLIGSAVTPGRYHDDVAAFLAITPGAEYLLTAHSCGSFADRTATGDLIYAVYLGPFDTSEKACAARDGAGRGIVRQLDDGPVSSFPTC